MDFLESIIESYFPVVEEKPEFDVTNGVLFGLFVTTMVVSCIYVYKKEAVKKVMGTWIKKPINNKWVKRCREPEEEASESSVQLSDDQLGFVDFKSTLGRYSSYDHPPAAVSINHRSFSSHQFSVSDDYVSCCDSRRNLMTLSNNKILSVIDKEKMQKNTLMMNESSERLENEFQLTMFCQIKSSLSKKKLLVSDVGAKTTILKIKNPDKYYRKKGALEIKDKPSSKLKVFETQAHSSAVKMADEGNEVTKVVRSVDGIAIKKKKNNFNEMGEINFKMVEKTSDNVVTETGVRIGTILKQIEAEARNTQELLKKVSAVKKKG